MEPQKMEKYKSINMKKLALSIILPLMAMAMMPLSAQTKSADGGTLVYTLPSTSIHLDVEAQREVYTPGPYAKYAKKYLGLDVDLEPYEKYDLLSVKLTPYLEADMEQRYAINLLGANGLAHSFFQMTSQGIVVLSDSNKGDSEFWRFPSLAENHDNAGVEATQTFTSVETTLYKNVKNAQGGYDKVAIQQSQVVEKSLEKKAQEIANEIFRLRRYRVQIITGDTDATFSGEALGAAVAEITRLEQDYMSLFIGKVETAVQKLGFDVVPHQGQERQLHVAFRLSDKQGLLMPDNVSGRPIVLEITPEKVPDPVTGVDDFSGTKVKKPNVGLIYYRVPSVCIIKVIDGQDLLLQTRIPVYQMGEVVTFPANIIK
jgi:hypothetical protein